MLYPCAKTITDRKCITVDQLLELEREGIVEESHRAKHKGYISRKVRGGGIPL